MKYELKLVVKRILTYLAGKLNKTKIGRGLCKQIIDTAMDQTIAVDHKRLQMKFAVPNSLNRFRVKTFSTKEPETLEWIDGFNERAILWDIGANIGLYSVYAAKAKKCDVFAFEPSVFNLELLARNIHLNDQTDQICVIPIPLSDRMAKSKLNLISTEWGGALSTFGRDFGWDGEPMNKVFSFQTLGLSMTDARKLLNLPQPDYVKMDVDGLEHLILRGGKEILKDVKGVLVEINDDFLEQKTESTMILQEAGLTMKEKRHGKMFENGIFQNTYNQIWERI